MEDICAINKTKKYIADTYLRHPISFVKGQGTKLYDSKGKEYLDFVSGLAVNNLGHCHPNVVKAISEQASKLLHISNLYYIPNQAKLAELIVENSFADKVFFSNSGAEANESAIKLARRYFYDRGLKKTEIITMKESFHGRTMAAVTATGQEKYHKGFHPLLPGFRYAEFNNLEDVQSKVNEKTCAVMVEPIQGEGGINIGSQEFLEGLYKLCRKKGLLLIFDEVQTGMGRTGELFAYQHYDLTPDIITLAKGLAGGAAIGAMAARSDVMNSFVPGTHASTFGGNPLACAAGIAAIKTIFKEDLISKCRRSGEYILKGMKSLKMDHPVVKDVRGRGLLVAMELDRPGKDIVNYCMGKGILINCIKENILRFIPPLIITNREIDLLLETLDHAMYEL